MSGTGRTTIECCCHVRLPWDPAHAEPLVRGWHVDGTWAWIDDRIHYSESCGGTWPVGRPSTPSVSTHIQTKPPPHVHWHADATEAAVGNIPQQRGYPRYRMAQATPALPISHALVHRVEIRGGLPAAAVAGAGGSANRVDWARIGREARLSVGPFAGATRGAISNGTDFRTLNSTVFFEITAPVDLDITTPAILTDLQHSGRACPTIAAESSARATSCRGFGPECSMLPAAPRLCSRESPQARP
jgi:hypothetical protein